MSKRFSFIPTFKKFDALITYKPVIDFQTKIFFEKGLLQNKNWHDFSKQLIKQTDIEMHNEKNERRRRKIVQKTATLVRSVKPGQPSTQIWAKENTAMNSIWRN